MEEAKSDEQAYEVLQHIEKTLALQADKLHKVSERFGSKTIKDIKSALTQARIDPLSKAMRDNYTAIAMITAGHTMLKTVALMEEDEPLQQIAGHSLEELAQLTMEISRVLLLTVSRGLIDDAKEADRIGKLAVEKTQKAWSSDNLKDADPPV